MKSPNGKTSMSYQWRILRIFSFLLDRYQKNPVREHEKERDPASCEAGTVDVCVNDYE